MNLKKAQIAGQVFVYILAVLIIGVIVAYGYRAIKEFAQRGEEVEYITFKTDMENTMKSILSSYGSIRKPTFKVPLKYDEVCFVKDGATCDQATEDEDYGKYRLMCSSIGAGARDNIFLIGETPEQFRVETLQIAPTAELVNQKYSQEGSIICLENTNGKLNLYLESLGDKVKVGSYDMNPSNP